MIWRLTYCNKEGVEARLDIIRGASTPVEVIEGTATPFILNYKMDKPDKSGHIMSSSADISIFETSTFNIDELKTSSETEIKVEYYINGVLDWSGFVIPDFFSRKIGSPAVVEMVASDRLGTLKGATLSGLNAKVSLSSLLSQCLAKTGLSLPVSATAQFTHSSGGVNILDTEILSQRLIDPKGRNISCYDIVRSILILTNATLRQTSGSWVLYNKIQHEDMAPSVTFGQVDVNAIRRIEPVASSVGVYQEYGGGRLHPDNYDFHDNLTGWTAHNGFTMGWRDEEVIGWNWETNEPIYGAETEKGFLINYKNRGLPPSSPWVDGETFDTWPYAEVSVPVTASPNAGSVDVEVNFNISQFDRRAYMDYLVLAVKGGDILALDPSGAFVEFDVNNIKLARRISFAEDVGTGLATASAIAKGTINRSDAADFTIKIRMFGGNLFSVIFVNLVSVRFSSQTVANGNLFKTMQGSNYTKKHEIDTSIFGDYITSGLNGYFYTYPIDDTSSLYLPSGDLSRSWTAYGDTNNLPILQHVTWQRSRLFSVAHDILRATIDVATFNPMAVYQDCAGKKYVIISASFDFLRSTVDVELEQVAYGSLEKRDYIYSYFGEGEEGISSVGGISGGGTGTGGGGMTAEQLELLNTVAGYWTLDGNGNLKTTYNAYSEKELTAYGFGGSGGGGGGGLIETVYGYSSLGGTFSNSDLNNTFNAYTINQLHLRITTLEAGGGTGGSVEWADILNKPSWIGATKPSYSWSEITGKPSTFPPSAHTHTKSQITDFAHTHPFTEITGTATATQIPNLDASKITSGELNIARIPTTTTGQASKVVATDGSGGTQFSGAVSINSSLASPLTISRNSGNSSLKVENNAISAYFGLGNGNLIGIGFDPNLGGVSTPFVISESGNIGIGTISPAYKLDVSGTGSFTGALYAPTASPATNNTQVATTAFVKTQGYLTGITKAQIEAQLTGTITSHNHSGVYEPVLGNPSTSGYLLSSSTAGVRSWVAPYSLPTASASVLGGVKIGTNVSIASGVISVHNPVTIGTANGLSLSTQQLSLAIATTASNGALSATDKTYIDLLKTFFEYDSTNNAIKALKTFYSVEEVSAYGYGGSGGGGGGGSLVTWSNETTEKVTLTVDGIAKELSKLGHTHAISNITGLQTALSGKFNNPAGTTAQYLRGDGSLATFPAIPQGSVTSVGLSAPTGFTVSGSPVSSSGTLELAFASGYSLPTTAKQTAWDNHLSASNNPHGVTKAQIGLGNVDNTGDLSKPISTAVQTALNGKAASVHTHDYLPLTGGTLTGTVTGTTFVGALTGNASSATKLQSARTIANVSFDGSANIDIPFGNLTSKPTTLSGYGITDAVTTNTAQTITGAKTFSSVLIAMGNVGVGIDAPTSKLHVYSTAFNGLNIQRSTAAGSSILFSNSAGNIGQIGFDATGGLRVDTGTGTSGSGSLLTIQSGGNVGIGVGSPTYKLDVSGTGRYTGNVSAPTFIGALTGNASTATILQTARTLWGQSFDGTGNVSGALTGVTNITASGQITVPKVIFSAAGWAMVQTGTELQMQYNGVAKMRFLNGGSIVAVEEITAYS